MNVHIVSKVFRFGKNNLLGGNSTEPISCEKPRCDSIELMINQLRYDIKILARN